QAATKQYVDNVSQGLQTKNSVQTIADAALPAYSYASNVLTASANGALPALGGYTPVAGDRVLVAAESGANAGYNGIYVVTNAGSSTTAWVLTRATDMDDDTEAVVGDHVLVDQGNHSGEMWMLSAKTGTLDAAGSVLTFIKMQFGNAYSADGTTLELTGYEFSVKPQGIGPAQLGAVSLADGGLSGGNGAALSVDVDGLSIDVSPTGQVEIKNVAPAKIGSLKTGTNAGAITALTPYNIVHGAGYEKGFPLFFDPVKLSPIEVDWAFVDANTIQVITASNYAAGGLGYLFLGAA
ncbi:MAG: hypothetical protein KGR26_10770, partial [Cyanobacteria bacterium REEB65]|nr:hypothetical protein [Cyanobacteria bacterium REEB65]